MPCGIRVRLRRSSTSEFVVRTDPFEVVKVVRGPPIRIYVRRLPQPKLEKRQKKEKVKALPVVIDIPTPSKPKPEPVEKAKPEPEPELEPESEPEPLLLLSAQYESSEDEETAPTDDRLTSRQRSLKQAHEAEDEDEDEAEDEDEEIEDLGPISKEEAALRKSEMRRRRRLALDKIEEQAKQETIERLLKKTSVRKAKSDKKRQRHGGEMTKTAEERRLEQIQIPHPGVVRYRNFVHGDGVIATVTLPDEFNLTFEQPLHRPARKVAALCGCGKPRRYSCAKTLRPVCSLDCYKQLHTASS